jgi:hypothetical protein
MLLSSFGLDPSDAKCGRQPLSNGENAVVGTTGLCGVGRGPFFYTVSLSPSLRCLNTHEKIEWLG